MSKTDIEKEAWRNASIAAHIPSREIGIDYFQATHPEILFRECSHYVELVSNPDQLPQILTRAIRVAVGRRGVAVVVIPGDVALSPLTAKIPHWTFPQPALLRPEDEDIESLAKLLNGGKRITMLCGAGCAGAHKEVVSLAGRLKAPIVHSFRGKEYLEYDNPFDVGMTGLIGFASGYAAMKDCDTLLMLGTDFPYRAFYPEDARIAQVDIRPEALGNRCSLTLGLLGSVKETIDALLPHLSEKTDSEHLDGALADYKKAREALDALAESKPDSSIIHPQYITKAPERTCRRRRDRDLRRGHTGHLDRALSEGQWQASYYWLVQSWFDGKCDAACYRGTSCQSQTPSDFTVWRRRIFHDDGRFHYTEPSGIAGESDRFE